ncbi:hypothetical protein D6764_05670, partial [Candidatus Woesearchaeota archaeon]
MQQNTHEIRARATHRGELPGAAYMIVGAVVATASLIINYMTESYRFVLFVIAGLGAFVYGVIKTFGHEEERRRALQRKHLQSRAHVKRNFGIHHAAHAAGQHAHRLVSGQRASPYHFCPYCATRIP